MTKIVEQKKPVTLVGGGCVGTQDIAEAVKLAPICVAADGGAAQVLKAGLMPEAVIGDLDSLEPSFQAQLSADCLHQITEQDTTDFDKCLRNIEAPFILGVGFCGGRLDHQLAVLHSLARHPKQLCILLNHDEIIFHCPDHFALPCEAGDRVSLFPMTRVCGRSKGLQWPIDGLTFEPMLRIGTSNRATGPVALWMQNTGMLCMVPRKYLKATITALLDRTKWDENREYL